MPDVQMTVGRQMPDGTLTPDPLLSTSPDVVQSTEPAKPSLSGFIQAHRERASGGVDVEPAKPSLSGFIQAYRERASGGVEASDAIVEGIAGGDDVFSRSSLRMFTGTGESIESDRLVTGRGDTAFKPHQISSATFKFTSGGCFRNRPTEISTIIKGKTPSPKRSAPSEIDANTTCKACGNILGTLTSDSYDGSKSCTKCGAKFHVCADGKIRYGDPGPTFCLDCLSSSGGNALPETLYVGDDDTLPETLYVGDDDTCQDTDVKIKCQACCTTFDGICRKNGNCPGCGACYTVCSKKVVHWGYLAFDSQKCPCDKEKDFVTPMVLQDTPIQTIEAPSQGINIQRMMAESKCPQCGHQGDYKTQMILNDGGSRLCQGCVCTYHYHCTADGKIGKAAFGAPGPMLCPTCTFANKVIREAFLQKIEPLKKCPACESVEISDTADGSKSCKICKAIFHQCKDGKVMYGSPGPKTCEFCSGAPPAKKVVSYDVDCTILKEAIIDQVKGAKREEESVFSGPQLLVARVSERLSRTVFDGCPMCKKNMVDLASWTIEDSSKPTWKRSREHCFKYCGECNIVASFQEKSNVNIPTTCIVLP